MRSTSCARRCPGYGFSDKPTAPGWGVERIARAWAQLMARLGYDRYGAQGGDWGSFVTTSIGQQDAGACRGHPRPVADRAARARAARPTSRRPSRRRSTPPRTTAGGTPGYSTQQSTRPQTLGYGLADSPAFQCAWIVEKFWSWTDCDGHPEDALSRDDLLDNVMLYWLPDNGASSARLYWESFHDQNMEPVTVPVGCSIFPKEIVRVLAPVGREPVHRHPVLG